MSPSSPARPVPTLFPGAEELLQQACDSWENCRGMPETTLLRLAVLRQLTRSLHAEKSRFLGRGGRTEAQLLRVWELRLEELRCSAPLEEGLRDLLLGSAKLRKRTRLLPEALLEALGKERFERYDRLWENTLAAEACNLGWRFWQLETWVEITQIEAWDRRLSDKLWPHGLTLFFESGSRGESSSQAASPAPPIQDDRYWLGRWILVLHSQYSSTENLAAEMAIWPGSRPGRTNASQWKLLFSPKPR